MPRRSFMQDIIGRSPTMIALRKQIALYASLPFPVLIEGESGCGKELIAGALHSLSDVQQQAYVIFDCAAIAPTLMEATLFGHSRGAYTGAHIAQAGVFEEANHGTLLLDEIGELPLALQTNLLRVLENGEYQRVGETHTRHSRARILAATNRDLRAAVQQGTFRRDLYHRLNVFTLRAPPLRDLGEDRFLLLDHFRAHYAAQMPSEPFTLSRDAQTLWAHYAFPGNTRELRNLVIRLMTQYPGVEVQAQHLRHELDPIGYQNLSAQPTLLRQKIGNGQFDLNRELLSQEIQYIAIALELAANNISQAARLLGLNRTTLYSRMCNHEKFGNVGRMEMSGG